MVPKDKSSPVCATCSAQLNSQLLILLPDSWII